MTELMAEFTATTNDHWHHGGGWWFLAPLFWIGVWILIIFVVRSIFWRRHRHHHRWGWGGGDSDPRSILAGRYARGEIDETEYRERLNVLNGPPNK